MFDKNNISVISKTIANLRFPLMLGVVLIHCVIIEPEIASTQGLNVVAFIIELVSHQITTPCVPLFFFISGYLFFLKFGDKFNVSDYGIQLKKRVRTLLIPYLFWNLVVIGSFAFLHKCLPSLINPAFNNVYQFSLLELCRSFWDFPGGQPICYQFWFLRDLLEAVILSPIIFLLVKYGRFYLMVVLIAFYIYNPALYPHQMMLTFFTLGAGFAVHRYDFVQMSRKIIYCAVPLFVLLILLASIDPMWSCRGGTTVTGAILYVWLASKVSIQNNKIGECGFFVYAFHGLPILVLSKMLVAILHPSTTIMWLVCYVLCFMIIVILSIVIYYVMKKFLPKFTAVITGGR